MRPRWTPAARVPTHQLDSKRQPICTWNKRVPQCHVTIKGELMNWLLGVQTGPASSGQLKTRGIARDYSSRAVVRWFIRLASLLQWRTNWTMRK